MEGLVFKPVNRLQLEIHQETDAHADVDISTFLFCDTFISCYIAARCSFSGYFFVCCVMEMQWTTLTQSLIPIPSAGIKYGILVTEAAAANRAWLNLMKTAAQKSAMGVEIAEALQSTVKGALQCFNDLLVQIENMETDPPVDT